MATYRKRGNTSRTEIRKKGHCLSASFGTKAAAKEWAIQKEAAIVKGGIAPKTERITKTVADTFDHCVEEVSPTKKGARWEMVRLTALKRERFAKLKLPDLTTQDLAAYRDRRLREVSPSTVIRNLNLISAVFTKARKEWGWMTDKPTRNVDDLHSHALGSAEFHKMR